MADEAGVESTEVADLTARKTELDGIVASLNRKIAALSDEADKKYKMQRQLFKDRNASTFKDLDVRGALIGANIKHSIVVSDVTYHLMLPKGNIMSDTAAFAKKPEHTDSRSGEVVKFGELTESELILMRFLSGYSIPGVPEKDLSKEALGVKLNFIRQIPALLVYHLAQRALLFESYLNTCLEIELGN